MCFTIEWQQTSWIFREFQYAIVKESGYRMIENYQKEFHDSITSRVWQMTPYILRCWIHNQHVSHCIAYVAYERVIEKFIILN